MANKKGETFHNLIDYCIHLEEDNSAGGNVPEMFHRLLLEYFFHHEVEESKSFAVFLDSWEAPSFMAEMPAIFSFNLEGLQKYVMGETINDSLCGEIMLSKQYLKSFFPHHTPSFAQLPEDVKTEIVSMIKEKNQLILNAFEKMSEDMKADRNRKMIALVALILKNIHRRTGRPVNRLEKSAEEILREKIEDCDEVFVGRQKQMTILSDDTLVKDLIKTFFKIQKFADINEMAQLYRQELERYRKRAIRAASE